MRHMLYVPHEKPVHTCMLDPNFFGESFGDVLVQVPQATPGGRVREDVSDCPRHSSIGVLDEDTRLPPRDAREFSNIQMTVSVVVYAVMD